MGGDFVPESVDSTPFSLSVGEESKSLRDTFGNGGCESTCRLLDQDQSGSSLWINIQVGDVVVIIDPNAARRDLKVGRIEQTYPGPDGVVRVVDVPVKDKVLKRPITRISPLEIQDS